MGYKSKGTHPNHINLNKCQRKFDGARPNGPPSPISNNMALFIEQNREKISMVQMLELLNATFKGDLKLKQLEQYCRKHKIKCRRAKNKMLIADMPNFKSSGTALDDYLANLEDPLDAADLLPDAIKRAYDALYENE
jgi:hypothetical protein